MLDENGEPAPVNTVASGLDYPGVGPEHAHLQSTGRVTYTSADDKDIDFVTKTSGFGG